MLTGLAAGAIAGLGSIGASLINRSSAKSATKYAAQQEWKYYQKQRELDYAYDSNQYFNLDKRYADFEYELARRYAQNSAAWQVAGLRNAGLNPILAASDGNFRGTFGNGVSRSSGSGGGSAVSVEPYKVDFENVGSAALQGMNYAANYANTEQNTETQESQENLNNTSAEKVKADTAKTMVETANSAKNGGYTNFASQLLNEAKSFIEGKPNVISSSFDKAKGFVSSIGDKLGVSFGHSAKDSSYGNPKTLSQQIQAAKPANQSISDLWELAKNGTPSDQRKAIKQIARYEKSRTGISDAEAAKLYHQLMRQYYKDSSRPNKRSRLK